MNCIPTVYMSMCVCVYMSSYHSFDKEQLFHNANFFLKNLQLLVASVTSFAAIACFMECL